MREAILPLFFIVERNLMAKFCPIIHEKVLYTECLDCTEKMCRTTKQKKYQKINYESDIFTAEKDEISSATANAEKISFSKPKSDILKKRGCEYEFRR